MFSKPFGYPGRNVSQLPVNFGRRRSEDQVANGAPRQLYVLETPQYVYFAVGQHNPRLGHVFYGKLGAAAFAGQPPDRPGLVVALERLHVLDLKAFHKKVVQSQQGQCVFHFKTIHEGLKILQL